jgi:UDP-N-acetylmuramoyl-L-alanyl-D-glutamate--2,6-diaminopimelate ligase
VAGIGRAGSAAAHALTARGHGPVHAWDGLGRLQEQQAAADLARAGVATHGGDGLALLDAPFTPGAVVKSPGLRFDTPLIDAAVRRGLPVLDESELGWLLDPRPLVAVTGTNGKSTTVSLVAAILQAAGRAPVTAGNTRFGVPYSQTGEHDGDVVVAELSSFQLEGCSTLRPDAALLTNITFDHLYRHGTRAAYAACKRRLFGDGDGGVPIAAVGTDQAVGRELADQLRERGATVVTFGLDAGADYRVLTVEPGLERSVVELSSSRGTRTLHPQLTGIHNALNIAGALALADALGMDADLAATAAEATAPLPGRFERIETGTAFDVVVDFAHNPDGVEQAVRAGRTILDRRGHGELRVVVSALSIVSEDQARAMGAAAADVADHLVLTTQRWRLDDPAQAVTPGLCEGAHAVSDGAVVTVEPDRRAAIAIALRAAGPGDLVLVLDRGELGGVLYGPDDVGRPFDDRAEVRSLLATMVA